MTKSFHTHSFHIPVFGIGYSIDTPIKVAHYGINSVIPIGDHRLIEKMREFHCEKMQIPFKPIDENVEDSRAKRITEYLNLIKDIVTENFNNLKKSIFEEGSEITKYFEMLPDTSILKTEYNDMLQLNRNEAKQEAQQKLREKLIPGSIDVNIMTKLDRVNYSQDNKLLPIEYNDAHAALRGFANSNLNSAIVLSAGLHPRLYNYMSDFDDFFPDSKGEFKKKITLKVSDYRSALIQGKFLAKKGLWVSEYRIESGLNCGGHAFITNGYLLGPALEEFKENKEQLISDNFELLLSALKNNDKTLINEPPPISVTVQGGVGTQEEHNFLLDHYKIDSVGWGTPFLLVPETVNIDQATMDLLCKAEEKDLYLSNISPIGVPFNTVRGTSVDDDRKKAIEEENPGSPCPKKHLVYNTEFTDKPICLASRQYQKLKIEELKNKSFDTDKFKKAYNKIVEKTCICIGLTNPAFLAYGIDNGAKNQGASVCPGPNMAYFSEIVTLKDMIAHIYGKIDLIKRNDRPNMFILELSMYYEYFRNKLSEMITPLTKKQTDHFVIAKEKMIEGINYYKNMFSNINIQNELDTFKKKLNKLI